MRRWSVVALAVLCVGAASIVGSAATLVATIPLASFPGFVAVNPVTHRVYVPLSNDTVAVIDSLSGSVVESISTDFPVGVAVNAVTNRIYVSRLFASSLAVVDGTTNAVIATVPTAGFPRAVAVNETTNRVYVANSNSGVTVIDGATNAVIGEISIPGGALDVAVNAATNRIYVMAFSSLLTVIDGSTNVVIASVPLGPRVPFGLAIFTQGVAVDTTTSRVYAANIATDSLVIVDGATNTIVGSVAVGFHPQGVAVNATTKRVYVVNQDSDDVSIVDGATGTFVESVAVGDQPRSVAVNQTTNRVYVTNVFPHSVSVIAELDTSPPTITANIVPAANAAGWHNSYVSVTWDLADPESGIASSSGCAATTLVSDTAGTTITCTATNGAGLSSSRSVTVKVDKTAPRITCSPDPASLWPPNGKLVDVTLAVVVMDELSGPAGFELVSVVSGESGDGPGRDDPAGDVQGFSIGTADTTGQLRAERSTAGDGRGYTVTYSGRDQAGNAATCAATISVPLAPIP